MIANLERDGHDSKLAKELLAILQKRCGCTKITGTTFSGSFKDRPPQLP